MMMKKIFLILSLLSIVACKDETTEKIAHPNIDQKVYFVGNKAQEVFVQQYQENQLQNVKARLFIRLRKTFLQISLQGMRNISLIIMNAMA